MVLEILIMPLNFHTMGVFSSEFFFHFGTKIFRPKNSRQFSDSREIFTGWGKDAYLALGHDATDLTQRTQRNEYNARIDTAYVLASCPLRYVVCVSCSVCCVLPCVRCVLCVGWKETRR